MSSEQILLIEPDKVKREKLSRQIGCTAKAWVVPELDQADVVLISVKPQMAGDVMAQLKPHLSPKQLVLSVMAGISIKTLEKGLAHQNLVRVMPNTPVLIGEGMSVFYSAEVVETAQLDWVRELFSACGKCIQVDKEDAIDAATAVSGSGPAYLFYLAEQMIESAISLDFKEEQAEMLVKQTLKGAALLLQQQEVPVAELRRRVTSPGGTTEAALKHFAKGHLDQFLREGLREAYLRAQQLSGKS